MIHLNYNGKTVHVFELYWNWGILKGGPQLADRADTADHIHKDATDRYAPCLRGGPFTCVVLVGA